MNRIDRLIAILTVLQSRKFVRAEFISEKYEISIRTVFRDLKALGEIGVPVGFENGKGYFIVQGYFLPPVSFSSEEANALVLVASLSEKFADKSIKKLTDSALDKMKAVLRSADKENSDFLHAQIMVYNPDSQMKVNAYLSEIQNALVHKQILNIKYINNQKKRSNREVEPIGLTFYSDQWHMVAWCWKRNEYRDFKTSQILFLENSFRSFRKESHLDINQYISSLK